MFLLSKICLAPLPSCSYLRSTRGPAFGYVKFPQDVSLVKMKRNIFSRGVSGGCEGGDFHDEAAKKKKKEDDEWAAWFGAELIREETDEMKMKAEFIKEEAAKNKKEAETQGEDATQLEVDEALEIFDTFKYLMKTRVPRNREDRKGFSVHLARYWRGHAYYAKSVMGHFAIEDSLGSDDFTTWVSTGRACLIEFLEHAVVLRWVKEKGGVRKELARSHYIDLVAEVDEGEQEEVQSVTVTIINETVKSNGETLTVIGEAVTIFVDETVESEGEIVTSTGETVTIIGKMVTIIGTAVMSHGEAVKRHGETVTIIGKTVRILNMKVKSNGETVTTNGGTMTANGEAVTIICKWVTIIGDPVENNGETVRIIGKRVSIFG